MTTHWHITSWMIGIIVFFAAYAMYKNRNPKAKIVHMIDRLMYIVIIVTGFLLYVPVMKYGSGTDHMWYGFKMLAGIWVIGSMEMVLIRTSKGKSTNGAWIQFVIAILVVLYLGLRLPQGWHPFA
ncbi:YisL family protein [Ectobacillus panaciterrae]|uniref:YisL family protein n=1 Tax=Ectobacillus panaciterrae TaxID=363872 RepID=UPI00040566C3|nr:YisL family protein [Ectobacillus panaciterrae]